MILVYIGAIAAFINLLVVTGLIAYATRNWHPFQWIKEQIRNIRWF